MSDEQIKALESALSTAQAELDSAIATLRTIGEEFANAGFQSGDRTVILSNVRKLLAEARASRAESHGSRRLDHRCRAMGRRHARALRLLVG